MRKNSKGFGGFSVRLAGIFLLFALIACAFAQDAAPHEIGAVYYADGPNFKALPKEAAPASGRAKFAAKIKGPYAAVRIAAGDTQKFRVCSADPTRYKLYALRSTKKSRDVTITKVNIWIGGAKSVLSNSEIPITIEPSSNGCFTITPNNH